MTSFVFAHYYEASLPLDVFASFCFFFPVWLCVFFLFGGSCGMKRRSQQKDPPKNRSLGLLILQSQTQWAKRLALPSSKTKLARFEVCLRCELVTALCHTIRVRFKAPGQKKRRKCFVVS